MEYKRRYFYYLVKLQNEEKLSETTTLTGVYRGQHIFDLVKELEAKNEHTSGQLIFYKEIDKNDFDYFVKRINE